MKWLAAAAFIVAGGGAEACFVAQVTLTKYPGSVTEDATTKGPIRSAWYDDPVTRYKHFVLGREDEPSSLWVDAMGNHGLCGHQLVLDEDHVFEDTAPRLADLDGDGTNEVIAVRSHVDNGAQLVVYRWTGDDLILQAATPYIGRKHRWLAPVGVADLDGDGTMEIAYVDRPHLARTLRIWRYDNGGLLQVAAAGGLTNHRIGEPEISGGIRDCGDGPELLLVTPDWSGILGVTFRDDTIRARGRADYSDETMTALLECRS